MLKATTCTFENELRLQNKLKNSLYASIQHRAQSLFLALGALVRPGVNF